MGIPNSDSSLVFGEFGVADCMWTSART